MGRALEAEPEKEHRPPGLLAGTFHFTLRAWIRLSDFSEVSKEGSSPSPGTDLLRLQSVPLKQSAGPQPRRLAQSGPLCSRRVPEHSLGASESSPAWARSWNLRFPSAGSVLGKGHRGGLGGQRLAL